MRVAQVVNRIRYRWKVEQRIRGQQFGNWIEKRRIWPLTRSNGHGRRGRIRNTVDIGVHLDDPACNHKAVPRGGWRTCWHHLELIVGTAHKPPARHLRNGRVRPERMATHRLSSPYHRQVGADQL